MSDDLFTGIDSLFNKVQPGVFPYSGVVNRFLSSVCDFAPAAREISDTTYADSLTWQIWRSALPKALKAPYLKYPAPKKSSEAEGLIPRLMQVHKIRREVAEEWEGILSEGGRLHKAYEYYGVVELERGPKE